MQAERYQFIEATKNGLPAHLLVNTALGENDESQTYPWLLTVTFPFFQTNQLGLCSKEESDRLYDCEDLFLDQLQPQQYRYLAHVSWNGARDMLIYVAEPDVILEKFTSVMAKIPYKELKVQKQHDPDWMTRHQFVPKAQ